MQTQRDTAIQQRVKVNDTIQPTISPAEVPTEVPTESPPTIPVITQDDEEETKNEERMQPTRRSRRIQHLNPIEYQSPKQFTTDALYSVIGNEIMTPTLSLFTPYNLQKPTTTVDMPTSLEECANGVVHPVTKETITKYHKLIEEPLLREVWMKAMCIELGRLAQGY